MFIVKQNKSVHIHAMKENIFALIYHRIPNRFNNYYNMLQVLFSLIGINSYYTIGNNQILTGMHILLAITTLLFVGEMLTSDHVNAR